MQQSGYQFKHLYRAAGFALFSRHPVSKSPVLFLVQEINKSNKSLGYSFPGGKVEDKDRYVVHLCFVVFYIFAFVFFLCWLCFLFHFIGDGPLLQPSGN
jgi:hypothetical protein